MDQLIAVLKNQYLILSLVVLTSIVALIAAMIAQYIYGLEPCIMCIYQRIPFAIVVIIGCMGLMRPQRMMRPALGISALAMAVNVGLAIYHSGIERKWWASAVEGCSVPLIGGNVSTEDLLASIMAAPTVSCSEIPWADPWFGLSMANYNVVLCLDLFIACALCLWLSRKSSS